MIPYNVVELTILLFLFKAYSPLYCRDSLVAIYSGGGGGGRRGQSGLEGQKCTL